MKLQHLKIYLNQRVPVKDYPDFNISIEDQPQLVHDLRHVTNKYYVQSYLKRFVQTNELQGTEISEDIYEMYCEPEIMNAQALSPTQPDHMTYQINNQQLTIRETPNVIGGLGTTGLRTWEAALYLCSCLASANDDFYVSGTVCELGAGTGLVGMSLLSSVERVVFTDGDANLLQSLQTNVELNRLDKKNNYSLQQLVWGRTEEQESSIPKADYVVAADVTYDTAVLPDLVYTINQFLTNGCKKCLIAATIRNRDTLQEFEKLLTEECLEWSIVDTFVPNTSDGACGGIVEHGNSSIWYRPGTPSIAVYTIVSH